MWIQIAHSDRDNRWACGISIFFVLYVVIWQTILITKENIWMEFDKKCEHLQWPWSEPCMTNVAESNSNKRSIKKVVPFINVLNT